MNQYIYEPYNLCYANYKYQITDLSRNIQYIMLVDKTDEQYQWQFLNLCDFLPAPSQAKNHTYIYIYEMIDTNIYKLYDYINKKDYKIQLNDISTNKWHEYISLFKNKRR